MDIDIAESTRSAPLQGTLSRLLLCLCGLGWTLSASAADNPDAPDYIGEFRQRSAAHEQAVQEAAGGNASTEPSLWMAFLERELAQTEAASTAELDEGAQRRLQRAQSSWRKQFVCRGIARSRGLVTRACRKLGAAIGRLGACGRPAATGGIPAAHAWGDVCGRVALS
ncbi:hypothetical protein [Aquimonas sp.]|jgi:hypothetical protein|uniref:hypothetical protein n=1 Tax=Aquimonas sp. TaxID=1872588 RepID=UPI0037C0876B